MQRSQGKGRGQPSLPPSLPIPNRVQNRTQSRHSVQGWGLGSKREGGPGVALYKSEVVTAPEVPVGPLQGRRVSGP